MTERDSPTDQTDSETESAPADEAGPDTDAPDRDETEERRDPRGRAGSPDDGGRRPTMSRPPEKRQRPPEHERPPERQGRPPRRREPKDDEDTKTKMIRYLYWGAFGLFFLFGAFAAFGFYTSIMRVIDIWITGDFEPIFRALFNLTVVFVSVLGLSLLVRRLDVSFSPTADD